MGLIKQALLIAFLAWVLVRIIMLNRILRYLGFGIPVFNHNPGPCKMFHVNGSEDFDILPDGLVVFSSGLHFHLNPAGVDPAMQHLKGMLYTFDLNNPEAKPKPLSYENFDDSSFLPHGIDLYVDPKTKEVSLFVVNHRLADHSIEIFQFDQENMVLKHRKTVVDKNIYSPNDVVAVGPNSFYTTNDRFSNNQILGMALAFYPLSIDTVAFYNGTHAKIVADGLRFPNGITVDVSGKYIFVANGFAAEVVVYERSDENNLIKRQRIETGVCLDNVNVDEDGDLWLGVPNIAFLGYSADFSKPCPGSVLQMKLTKVDNKNVPFKVDDIREVFSNSGTGEFKCVSSASFYRGKLLVGNPFSNLMYCEVLSV